MAIVQLSKIKVRTGSITDLPQLDEGELGWASDERRLFIGNSPDALNPQPWNTEIITQYSSDSSTGGGSSLPDGGLPGQFLQHGTGNVAIWADLPTYYVELLDTDGNTVQIPVLSGGTPTPVSPPASATSAGTPGQIAYDSSFVYVCVAVNTWKRSSLSSW